MSQTKALSSFRTKSISRRTLLRSGAALAAAGGVPNASAAPALSFGGDMYQSIGVRPVINAKGVFTMLSGSLMLPECCQAMQQASRNFVQIDELMEAVGKRLAELTGAESAIVTCGCAAALAHATAACLAAGDPEKIHRLPNLDGLKSEVIVPRYSRNIYDQSIRMVGPKIISVANEEEMRMAINDRTAMAMVVGSPRDRGPFGLKEVAAIAHEYDVPVLLDAAAEALTIPNVHLERGADLVAYSGGKIGISGDELYKQLYDGDPRIVLASSTGDRRHPVDSSATVMPWQLQPGEAAIVAAEIHRALSEPRKGLPNSKAVAPKTDVSGQWDVEMLFVSMTAKHRFVFEQDGGSLLGTHIGETTQGDLKGWIEGSEIRFRSAQPLEGAGIHFAFMGKVSGDTMAGEVDLGEYGTARWSARRHSYDEAGKTIRGVKHI